MTFCILFSYSSPQGSMPPGVCLKSITTISSLDQGCLWPTLFMYLMRLWSLSQETSVLILDRPVRQYLKHALWALALTRKFSRVQLTLLRIHLHSRLCITCSIKRNVECIKSFSFKLQQPAAAGRGVASRWRILGYCFQGWQSRLLAYAMSHCLVRI